MVSVYGKYESSVNFESLIKRFQKGVFEFYLQLILCIFTKHTSVVRFIILRVACTHRLNDILWNYEYKDI